MADEWLRNSVLKGLQGIMLLRLDGSPSADTMQGTANAWLAVLANLPHSWDQERDAPRIQRAFLTLAANSERWPAPKNFIDALPPVPPQLKIDGPKGKYSESSRKMVSELLSKMKARA